MSDVDKKCPQNEQKTRQISPKLPSFPQIDKIHLLKIHKIDSNRPRRPKSGKSCLGTGKKVDQKNLLCWK